MRRSSSAPWGTALPAADVDGQGVVTERALAISDRIEPELGGIGGAAAA